MHTPLRPATVPIPAPATSTAPATAVAVAVPVAVPRRAPLRIAPLTFAPLRPAAVAAAVPVIVATAVPTAPAQPPAELVIIRNALPVPLAAAFAALPLLLGIWVLALLRFIGSSRRRWLGRSNQTLAMELGLAADRLAGLSAAELAQLRGKVAFDELTGVMRRSGGLATLDREIARARRQATPLTLAFIDVDGLKQVNDEQGHAAGDRLLKSVVEVLAGRLRADDAIFRYGGDEFCCVLPNAELGSATRIIDEALATARSRGETFSVGLAQLGDGDTKENLLSRADSELYRGRAARGYEGRQ